MSIYLERVIPHVINFHYFNRYSKFIKYCITRPLTQSTDIEIHHILPRSYGGDNSEDNLIRLTYREHFVAHWLLWKACGGRMTVAFNLMNGAEIGGKRVNSRVYSKLREEFIEWFRGENHPNFGRKFSDIHRKRISEGLKGVNAGKITAKDINGNTLSVMADDPRIISGELVGVTKGKTKVISEDGSIFMISVQDEKYINGEYKTDQAGFVSVKGADGKCYRVHADDPRFLAGELVGVRRGVKDSVDTRIKKSGAVRLRHQINGHPQKGKRWIMNEHDRICKLIGADDEIPHGWSLGRKQKW